MTPLESFIYPLEDETIKWWLIKCVYQDSALLTGGNKSVFNPAE